MPPPTIVIASGNQGKIREIRAALAESDWRLPAQAELGIKETEEPHATFAENALAKARNAARTAGLPALADDSGLVVPALGGAPGVRSARYAGADANDAANNAKLAAAMQNIDNRRAFYYAVIVFINAVEDPAPVFAEGFWRGEIARTPAGAGGFGYDPLFFDPQQGKTGGEMTLAEKQQVSHRGQSLRSMMHLLRQRRLL